MQNKTKGFATISDVAKYAKVGKTSVSRYLNGEQEKLSDTLREKISHAIEHLDFRPNHSARMLKAGKSKLIGLLLADVSNPYSIDVLKGVEGVCQREGYMLIVCNTDNQKVQQDRYLALLDAHRVDGIIVNTTGMAPKQINTIKHTPCPLVLIDRIDTSLAVDTVGLDNHSATTEACHLLQKKAYDSILVITESTSIEPRYARVSAIKQFSEKHRLIYRLIDIENMGIDQLAQSIEKEIRTQPEARVALFATNGIAMMSTAKALKRLGLTAGSEVGFIGIDDPEWAQLFDGGITVMRQPTHQIGQTACEHLLSRIQGNTQPPRHTRLQATLIIRAST